MTYAEIQDRINTIINRKEQIQDLINNERTYRNQERSRWTGLTQLEHLEKLQNDETKELNELIAEAKKYK